MPASVQPRVQPIFMTVDPDRDTPDVVGRFAAAFHPKFIGLAGSADAGKQAVAAYPVHRAKVFVPVEPEEDYLISHSANVYLMAPNGDFLTLFTFATPAEDITGMVVRHVAEFES